MPSQERVDDLRNWETLLGSREERGDQIREYQLGRKDR